MKKPLVYISGPISKGDTLIHVHCAMHHWEHLRRLGFIPICPHWSALQQMAFPITHREWLEYDIPLVEKCDAVFRFPGESVGADMETKHAGACGIPVFTSITELQGYFKDVLPAKAENDLASRPRSPVVG